MARLEEYQPSSFETEVLIEYYFVVNWSQNYYFKKYLLVLPLTTSKTPYQQEAFRPSSDQNKTIIPNFTSKLAFGQVDKIV